MNYIKHLTGFFNKSNQDPSIGPIHISLYLALFQRWNLNRFKNPIIISREEIMKSSKIKSKVTYHKYMKELQDKKYIIYYPSFNPHDGTEVILPDLSLFEKVSEAQTTSTNFEQTLPKNELVPHLTSTNFERTSSTNERTQSKNDQVYIYNNKTIVNNIKHIDIDPEKNEHLKTTFQTPTIDQVKHFFQEKNINPIEAEKYFNYYCSKGWLIGGKTKMKDWQAAARNWIINLEKFSQSNTINPKNLNVSNSKDYAEPL